MSIISGQLGLRPGARIYLKNESLWLNESSVVLLLSAQFILRLLADGEEGGPIYNLLGCDDEQSMANVEQDMEHCNIIVIVQSHHLEAHPHPS